MLINKRLGDDLEMKKSENDFSRLNRKKKRSKTNRLLNIAIAVVVMLIILTATIIFSSGDGSNQAKEDSVKTGQEQEKNDLVTNKEKTDDQAVQKGTESIEEQSKLDDNEVEEVEIEEPEEPGTITHMSSDDQVVAETIVNTAWEPLATKQTGEHISSYDGNTVDWNEKKEAIAYAIGNTTDSLIYWKIKNGGSPTTSIGIVSTQDKVEKYRVYLEWVDDKGWKPTKVDVLTTLNFNY